MKAFVTSIGEPTRDLCISQLERQGFEVELVEGESSLADKLNYIYHQASKDFIRVDADVVPNKNLTPETFKNTDYQYWWFQYVTYDWYKQDTTHGGVQFIKREALPALRANISKFIDSERPESQMFRLEEFHSPRRCISNFTIMGIHGFKQGVTSKVKEQKRRRGQYDNYDFELAERLEKL